MIWSNLYGNIKLNGNRVTIYFKYKWTSAGVKSSFAYSELITTFENSIINPNDSFCIGMDYRIPVMHGLTDKKFINSLKMSPSFNEASFATEYLSIWAGSSSESWFNFSKMTKYRKIKNPEFRAKKSGANQEFFYILSMDKKMSLCQVIGIE